MSTFDDYHLTDLGNARRLVRNFGTILRHDPARGWAAFNSTRWVFDEAIVMQRAKATVGLIYTEASNLEDVSQRKAVAAHATKSESEARIRALVNLAASEPEIHVLPDVWDQDQSFFNAQNGTVDLASNGMLFPHNPHHLITKLSPARAPDQYTVPPGCPTWLAFLDRTFAGRSSLIDFVQRAVGYSLTGSVQEQCMFFLYGLGANGKSTLLRVLLDLLGDYAIQADADLLLARRGEAHPTNLARLAGARVVVCQEVDAGRRLAESLVKQLTGGDRITARYMHRDFFEFDPTFKVWLAANHKPVIRGTDNAIWRRIRLIPFTVTIPEEEQDPELPEKLLDELDGIMAWAIDGCREWQKYGLGMPEQVAAATAAYREEMDVLGGFFGEECELGDTLSAPASELYRRYRSWCEANGEYPISQTAFGLRLSERPELVRFHDTKKRAWWKGIGLRMEGVGGVRRSLSGFSS